MRKGLLFKHMKYSVIAFLCMAIVLSSCAETPRNPAQTSAPSTMATPTIEQTEKSTLPESEPATPPSETTTEPTEATYPEPVLVGTELEQAVRRAVYEYLQKFYEAFLAFERPDFETILNTSVARPCSTGVWNSIEVKACLLHLMSLI